MSQDQQVLAVCVLCKDETRENPFAVPTPVDPIGAALMSQHWLQDHGLKSYQLPRRPEENGRTSE